jgi:hypothetical protein
MTTRGGKKNLKKKFLKKNLIGKKKRKKRNQIEKMKIELQEYNSILIIF